MKKILIVSPYFAPENSVASIRFTKIAKYLQKMGHDVTVLCTQMNVQWVVDKTLERDLKELKKVVRIKYPQLLYYTLKKHLGTESNQIKRESRIVNNEKLTQNKNSGSLIWSYTHFCSMLLGRRFIKYIKNRGEMYDVVITTYSPISGHMVGNYMKKHRLCTTWIEDFRDPLTLHCSKSFLTFLTYFHGVTLMKRSDYITTVSKGAARKLIQEAQRFRVDIQDKVKIINNGYDDIDRAMLNDIDVEKDKLTFTYCGTLYEIGGEVKNDISPLFEVLAALIEEGKIDSDFVEINYAGGNGDTFYRFAEKYGLKESAHSYGMVSRDQSLSLQRASDVIMVLVWNNKGETGVISGKFYETLLVQRHVLAIVKGNQPNSELKDMIQRLQCGFAYEEIDGDKRNMSQLREWILDKYNEKRESGTLKYCNNGEEKKYSHQYLAKKFEKLF